MDFRVSTCPTLFGEKAVLRILDSSMSIPLDQLGYEDFQKEIFLRNLHKPYGMFLVTGPTGSGKTVSLYTGIDILNREDVNISTAEDPVEINLAGINQVQVDERTGMTFEKALKAFLRQDPDIILVGEIRDIITGNIALKAAQTGHMVMSTLHTNDAPQTLTRMVDMGLQPFAIATAVNVVTAQRLARRLCGNCKRPLEHVPKEALLKEGFTEEDVESEGLVIFEQVGCDRCNDGYKGRLGIYQVMEMSEEMKRMIMEGRNAIDLADQAAREGIWDIRTAGINKVKQGLTSIDELNRVTQE
jgi:type IV pilus assembly protein PilB